MAIQLIQYSNSFELKYHYAGRQYIDRNALRNPHNKVNIANDGRKTTEQMKTRKIDL